MIKSIIRMAGIVAVLLAGIGNGSAATSLYWKSDGTNPGGDGTWDLTSSVWSSTSPAGGTTQVWNNTGDGAGAYSANFGGTGGTVTAESGITAFQINFANTSGTYAINGGPITLTTSASSYAVNLKGVGTSATVNSLLNVVPVTANHSVRFAATNSGTLTLAGGLNNAGTNAAVYTFEGGTNSVISVTGNITKASTSGASLVFGSSSTAASATYILSGDNTGVAGVQIVQGTLITNANGALRGTVSMGNSTTTAKSTTLLIGTAGVTVNNSISLFNADANDTRVIGSQHTSGTSTYSGGITIQATGLKLTAATGGKTVYTGNINEGGAQVRPITVGGGGTTVFARAGGNAYDGGTTVTENSTLLVNNSTAATSGTGTGNVVVENGSTIGGTGTVSGLITLNAGGMISAGDPSVSAISTTLYAGGVTWNSNDLSAGFLVDLGAGSSSDLITLGSFTKGTGTSFLFDFSDAGGFTFGNTYTLLTFSSLTGFSESDFAFTSDIADFGGTFALNANSLTFTATAVPEPQSVAMLCGLMLLFGLMRRRAIKI